MLRQTDIADDLYKWWHTYDLEFDDWASEAYLNINMFVITMHKLDIV